MRIISGSLGSRNFASPASAKTHPMSDRIRSSLFDVLGDIHGLSVLDAFAGSGALSFEAVSRGAAQAVAVERDRAAQQTIEQNIRSLGLSHQVKLVNASVNTWLKTNEDRNFDIVLCDPPYNDVQENLLLVLAERVNAGGVIVYSLPPNEDVALTNDGFQLKSTKLFGDAKVLFYKHLRS